MEESRKITRIHKETNVLCKGEEMTHFLPATVYNYSINGMYLESDLFMKPGSDVMIKVGNYMPATSGPDGFNNYSGTVIWCETIPEGESYGVGVQLSGTPS